MTVVYLALYFCGGHESLESQTMSLEYSNPYFGVKEDLHGKQGVSFVVYTHCQVPQLFSKYHPRDIIEPITEDGRGLKDVV